MNLYGDWANTEMLARELEARGCQAAIDRKSAGDDVDFGSYSFIHIGSGTERSLRACMSDLARSRDAFITCIESGMHVLMTGNSHELLGRAVTGPGGDRFEALGLLDFETVAENSRVTGDCVCEVPFLQDKLIGFINRAGHGQDGEIDRPFRMQLGPGANDHSTVEGVLYKNVLGTYMTGPILVRNPPLLRYFADLLCPDHASQRVADEPLFAAQEAAYRMALSELTARIGQPGQKP